MTLTSDTETRQLTVTVRVPNGADDDLTTDAQRRLSRAEGVLAVTIEDLRGLQPGLSATEVTVRITVETEGSVAALFRTRTGVEIVD